MGAPNDPSIIWPDSFQDPGPIDPRLYALVMRQAMGSPGALNLSPDAGLAPDDDEMAPHLMAARVLSDYVASQKAQGAGPADQGPSAISSTPAPVSTALPDAPEDDTLSPSAGMPDAVPTLPQGVGAMPAESAAVPASAQVATNGSSVGLPASAAPDQGAPQSLPAGSGPNPPGAGDAPSWSPDSQVRPELSAGPDALVANWATAHPGAIPPGLSVDPKTGAVSRWRFGVDPRSPGAATLEPLDPQSKQALLERIVGAPTYPFGMTSPQETAARLALGAVRGKGIGGASQPGVRTSPGGVQYVTTPSLTPSQRNILDQVADTGRQMGMSPDMIGLVANQAFYETSLGGQRVNPGNSKVKGLFQYRQDTWDGHASPDAPDIASDRDQIVRMYQDAVRYRARYEREVANRELKTPMSFEDYFEFHHHLGDSAIKKGKQLPSEFHSRIKNFGFRILSLPPR